MSSSPVPGQICAGWSKTGSARLRCWCTIVQTNSSWSFQIQRCPGFPHSCRSLRHFKGGKKGTNKLILLCYGTSKSPAGILIDKTLMIIQVQPKYRVCLDGLMRHHKHQLSESQSFLNGFISVSIDLTSSHFQYLHKQYFYNTAWRLHTLHFIFSAGSCSWTVITRCM